MSWCARCRFGPRSGFTHPIINTQTSTCHHQDTQTSSHHGYHTDITTLSHKHQHNITATQPSINTQTSTQDHYHTNVNTTSLSRNHVPHASTLSISTNFSLFRIVKPNMWSFSWVIRSSGPFFGLFSWLNFNCMAIGFFTFFILFDHTSPHPAWRAELRRGLLEFRQLVLRQHAWKAAQSQGHGASTCERLESSLRPLHKWLRSTHN